MRTFSVRLGERSAKASEPRAPTVCVTARPENSSEPRESSSPALLISEIEAPMEESVFRGSKRPVVGPVSPPPHLTRTANEIPDSGFVNSSSEPQPGSGVSFLQNLTNLSLAPDDRLLLFLSPALDSELSGETLENSTGYGSHHLDAPEVDLDFNGSDDEDATDVDSDGSHISTTSGSKPRELEARSIHYQDGTLRPREAKKRARKSVEKA